MIKINVTSLFRQSQVWENRFINQAPRFFNQIARQELGFKDIQIGKIVCVYTESADNTLEVLEQEKNRGRFNIQIVEHGSNYSSVKSVVDKTRLVELSSCGNAALENAKDDCDYILHVESDLLIYDEFLIARLYNAFNKIDKLGVISPLVFVDINYQVFYDYYVFRTLDGVQWRNEYPWTRDFNKHEQYIPMSSVGSCALIKADLVRDGCNFGENAFMNLCSEVIKRDYKVFCDKRLYIYHPFSNQIINGRAT